MTWFRIQQSKALRATKREIEEKTELRSGRRWKVSAHRISNIFASDPTLNLTIFGTHVMVNLLGRRSILRPSLTDIYFGITPSADRGYDTVSTSSLYYPTRLKTDSRVLFFSWLYARRGPDRWTSEFNLYVLSDSGRFTNLCKFCGL